MKILIIEDDSDFVTALVEIVSEIQVDKSLKIVKSRDSALKTISEDFFDLILLDLKIPTSDESLDEEPAHGHAVFSKIRLQVPGTPIIVLTGSSGEEYIPTLLAHSERSEIWGGSPLQLVSFHRKHLLDSFPDVLKKYVSEFNGLASVELNRNGTNLLVQEDRLIRIFCKKFDGVRCSITKIGGGLSGSKVFRLILTNSGGALIHDVICKISDLATIQDEGKRYNLFIARLNPDATPRKLSVLEFGGGDMCGVFYGLAEGFNRTAFDMINCADPSPNTFLASLKGILAKWTSNVEAPTKILEIRRAFISDTKFSDVRDLASIPWIDKFENYTIQSKQACSHGDLHGLNVLVSNEGIPILIDYGDVANGPASVDPITLELSLFFHPDGPLKNSIWPTGESAEMWGELDSYLIGCPCPEFVRSCRNWAAEVAVGDREVAAVAYAYLVRQLKYDNVDIDRVNSLLSGVKKFYDRT